MNTITIRGERYVVSQVGAHAKPMDTSDGTEAYLLCVGFSVRRPGRAAIASIGRYSDGSVEDGEWAGWQDGDEIIADLGLPRASGLGRWEEGWDVYRQLASLATWPETHLDGLRWIADDRSVRGYVGGDCPDPRAAGGVVRDEYAEDDGRWYTRRVYSTAGYSSTTRPHQIDAADVPDHVREEEGVVT